MTGPIDIAGMSDDEIVTALNELIAEAGSDERKVLLFLADRLVRLGQPTYGKLDLKADPRDFGSELSQELADGMVYLGKMFIRGALSTRRSWPPSAFTSPRRSTAVGPARFRNEAGQPVEDDDLPDEDWP